MSPARETRGDGRAEEECEEHYHPHKGRANDTRLRPNEDNEVAERCQRHDHTCGHAPAKHPCDDEHDRQNDRDVATTDCGEM